MITPFVRTVLGLLAAGFTAFIHIAWGLEGLIVVFLLMMLFFVIHRMITGEWMKPD